MLRHVIVEGPDGAGKDTFITDLLKAIPELTQHERASDSVRGPVPNLAEWVSNDVGTMGVQPQSVYNRHPVISEPIYGTVVRYQPRPMFENPDWVRRAKHFISAHALLVLCLPPLSVVNTNVRLIDTPQMPGVIERIGQLWSAYDGLRWPGVMMRWDYTSGDRDRAISTIRKVIL